MHLVIGFKNRRIFDVSTCPSTSCADDCIIFRLKRSERLFNISNVLSCGFISWKHDIEVSIIVWRKINVCDIPSVLEVSYQETACKETEKNGQQKKLPQIRLFNSMINSYLPNYPHPPTIRRVFLADIFGADKWRFFSFF